MDKFLRLKQVKEISGLSRSTIYRFMENGTFPKNVDLGPRLIAWRESELKEWFINKKN
jgi:prophage regulatory protein